MGVVFLKKLNLFLFLIQVYTGLFATTFALAAKKNGFDLKALENKLFTTPQAKALGRTKQWKEYVARFKKNPPDPTQIRHRFQDLTSELCEVLAVSPQKGVVEVAEEVAQKLSGVSPLSLERLKEIRRRTFREYFNTDVKDQTQPLENIQIGGTFNRTYLKIEQAWTESLRMPHRELRVMIQEIYKEIQEEDSFEEEIAKDDYSVAVLGVEDECDEEEGCDPFLSTFSPLLEEEKEFDESDPDEAEAHEFALFLRHTAFKSPHSFVEHVLQYIKEKEEFNDLHSKILKKLALRFPEIQRLSMFVHSDLTLFDFRGTNSFYLVFTNVKAEGVFLSSVVIFNFESSHSNMDNAMMNGTKLVQAKFFTTSMKRMKGRHLELERGNILSSDLSQAVLLYATLDQTYIYDTPLVEADLSHASLIGTHFEKVDLNGAVFKGASGHNIIFENVKNWEKADWRGLIVNKEAKLPFPIQDYPKYGVVLDKTKNADEHGNKQSSATEDEDH